MKSLRSRLFVIWLLSLAAALSVGVLLVQLYQQSSSAQVARADGELAAACSRIADRYAYYTTGWAGPEDAAMDAAFRRDLVAVVSVALAESAGIAGGIWQGNTGALAYAFPADSTGSTKPHFPEAERVRIQSINEDALDAGHTVSDHFGGNQETLLLAACPLRGPVSSLTAWTMTRVAEAAGWDRLRLGVAVLLALMLAMSAMLAWLLLVWARHVARIEATLVRHAAGALPRLKLTGERELDRIIAALNSAGERLEAERRRAETLAARVALAERLAALGRVAAGIAHEIRNPIAAMRLKAENALAGDALRRSAALEAILIQIGRLDRLMAELLAMTQRREPVPQTVDLAGFLHDCAGEHGQPGITLQVQASPGPARFDPDLMRRALASLLQNAVRHTPEGGTVMLDAERAGAVLRLSVADSGVGVAPEVRTTLFEPFVSGRADGTGLGLAIARELAEAQGGRLVLIEPGGDAPGHGAVFAIELPQESACPPS